MRKLTPAERIPVIADAVDAYINIYKLTRTMRDTMVQLISHPDADADEIQAATKAYRDVLARLRERHKVMTRLVREVPLNNRRFHTLTTKLHQYDPYHL